jgi:hypothetical protein
MPLMMSFISGVLLGMHLVEDMLCHLMMMMIMMMPLMMPFIWGVLFGMHLVNL